MQAAERKRKASMQSQAKVDSGRQRRAGKGRRKN
jgi:hypothetical protein